MIVTSPIQYRPVRCGDEDAAKATVEDSRANHTVADLIVPLQNDFQMEVSPWHIWLCFDIHFSDIAVKVLS